jgi:hypothetical protein
VCDVERKTEATQTSPRNTVDCHKFEALQLKVETLGEIFAAVLDECMPRDSASSSTNSANLEPKTRPGSDIESRIDFLEKMEIEHSRLLTLKGKADAELYTDIENMKQDIKVLPGKADYLIRAQEESDAESDAESDDGSQAFQEAGDSDESLAAVSKDTTGIQSHVPVVPEHVRALPYLERMRALGYGRLERPNGPTQP